jgi:1-deoxy-D-xylulose-5-phosphate reductoisomerase
MNGLGELAYSVDDALDSAMMTDASARRIAAEVVGQNHI